MKNYGLFLAGMLFLLSACTSEDDIPEVCSTPLPPNYFPLAVGNYWIYNWYARSLENSEERFYLKDTMSITGMETIKGKEYFRFERSNRAWESQISYRRDSLGYIVDETGKVCFTTENQGTIFQTFNFGGPTNSFLLVVYGLRNGIEKVEVPAGTFACLVKVGQFIYTRPDEDDYEKAISDYFFPDIGIVKGIRHFANGRNPNYLEYRMTDYHIE